MQAIESAATVPFYLYDINFGCYYGFLEAMTNVASYGTVASDPLMIYTNVIYNFGLVYDSIK